MKIADSLKDIAGRTPMVWLHRLTEARVPTKLEAFNPGGGGMGQTAALGSERDAFVSVTGLPGFLIDNFFNQS